MRQDSATLTLGTAGHEKVQQLPWVLQDMRQDSVTLTLGAAGHETGQCNTYPGYCRT